MCTPFVQGSKATNVTIAASRAKFFLFIEEENQMCVFKISQIAHSATGLFVI